MLSRFDTTKLAFIKKQSGPERTCAVFVQCTMRPTPYGFTFEFLIPDDFMSYQTLKNHKIRITMYKVKCDFINMLSSLCSMYSRVHKSLDSFFSKILEKPSIVQKKMIPHIKGLDFSQR